MLRDGETVSPLELFFDLVFVLAITQCTALMAHDPTWAGIGRGLIVLGLLWWSWVGYAWLTSVVDPDEGPVRLVLFVAMAALVVTSLCVPEAFGDLGMMFDVGGPLVIDPAGWRLVPGHFAERHGLIVIVALGESIVAIGLGAEGAID